MLQLGGGQVAVVAAGGGAPIVTLPMSAIDGDLLRALEAAEMARRERQGSREPHRSRPHGIPARRAQLGHPADRRRPVILRIEDSALQNRAAGDRRAHRPEDPAGRRSSQQPISVADRLPVLARIGSAHQHAGLSDRSGCPESRRRRRASMMTLCPRDSRPGARLGGDRRLEREARARECRNRAASPASCTFMPKSIRLSSTCTCPCGCMSPPMTPNDSQGRAVLQHHRRHERVERTLAWRERVRVGRRRARRGCRDCAARCRCRRRRCRRRSSRRSTGSARRRCRRDRRRSGRSCRRAPPAVSLPARGAGRQRQRLVVAPRASGSISLRRAAA